MSDTAKLALPLIEAAQAQKHVTHNEALGRLDALVQLAVTSRSLAAPPLNPAEGDRYLIAAGAGGDWLGHSGHIAYRLGGGWSFAVPQTGWRAWVSAESTLLVFNGTAWVNVVGGALQNLPMLGVNATADATNKLTVATSDALFTHVGTSMRLKLNKSNAASTASVLYQTAFSGRAEFGLTGDDNFHIKVSPDGTSWTDALTIDRSSGVVTLKPGSVANAGLANMTSATLKGRASAGNGPPEDLTAAQAARALSLWARMIAAPMALS